MIQTILTMAETEEKLEELTILAKHGKRKMWSDIDEILQKSLLFHDVPNVRLSKIFDLSKKEFEWLKGRQKKLGAIDIIGENSKSITINANPTKNELRTQISNLSEPFHAFAEIIDNLLDAIARSDGKKHFIYWYFDIDKKRCVYLTIKCSGVGMGEQGVKALLTPGESFIGNNERNYHITATFGHKFVSASYQIAPKFEVYTSPENEQEGSYIHMDEGFLEQEDWHIPVKQVNFTPEWTGGTKFVFSDLKIIDINLETLEELVSKIRYYYGYKLYKLKKGTNKTIEFIINGPEPGMEWQIKPKKIDYTEIFSFNPLFLPLLIKNYPLYDNSRTRHINLKKLVIGIQSQSLIGKKRNPEKIIDYSQFWGFINGKIFADRVISEQLGYKTANSEADNKHKYFIYVPIKRTSYKRLVSHLHFSCTAKNNDLLPWPPEKLGGFSYSSVYWEDIRFLVRNALNHIYKPILEAKLRGSVFYEDLFTKEFKEMSRQEKLKEFKRLFERYGSKTNIKVVPRWEPIKANEIIDKISQILNNEQVGKYFIFDFNQGEHSKDDYLKFIKDIGQKIEYAINLIELNPGNKKSDKRSILDKLLIFLDLILGIKPKSKQEKVEQGNSDIVATSTEPAPKKIINEIKEEPTKKVMLSHEKKEEKKKEQPTRIKVARKVVKTIDKTPKIKPMIQTPKNGFTIENIKKPPPMRKHKDRQLSCYCPNETYSMLTALTGINELKLYHRRIRHKGTVNAFLLNYMIKFTVAFPNEFASFVKTIMKEEDESSCA